MLLTRGLVVGLLCGAAPVAAQRPTAELARATTSFWPLEAVTGTVLFAGSTGQPLAPGLRQAERARAWLATTCTGWTELHTQVDSTQLYRGQLRGAHAGVVLHFTLVLNRAPAGWHYQLLAFQVGAPTGEGLLQYVPLAQVLADADYRPDMMRFQQQLQRALPRL